jgi:beta-mannosidase
VSIDLSGAWRAAEGDEALRRAYPEPDFDDSGWATLDVPGHWRSSSDFSESNGPLWYRRRVDGVQAAEGERSWLVLDGVFYQSDVWLDGSYLGDTEGYFFPHAFDISTPVAERSEHVLAVEVACSKPGDLSAKRNITGVFQHWDCLDPDWNPGGIWRGVRIERTGPVRIHRLRVLCVEAGVERALLSLRALLDSGSAGTVRLVTRVGGVDHELEQPVAAGENRVNWNVAVENPALWWPWALGALGGQALTDVSVSVFFSEQEAPSDQRVVRTGLRQVRMKNFVFTVNGERLFLKGANQGPVRMDLAAAEQPDFERDVLLARDAGLDLLRVHGHISRPELYEAADRHGMLLWQDFPLQWSYARGIRKQAARQAREAVDLLGHHPSIALWCGHNEPMGPSSRELSVGSVVSQQAPRWNKTLLDSSVKRSFEQSDSSRPVVAHSGVVPGDSHLYFGWYQGVVDDLPGFLGAWPRVGRFVSEFGARSVPTGWHDADGALGSDVLDEFSPYVPRGDFATFEEWRDATQEYQAVVVRRAVEWLRRLKYRPTGGFAAMLLADSWPGVTWSVLGFDRMPKLAYEALRLACAPVIVVADPLPSVVAPGDAVALDVHVVSDLRVPVEGAVVRAVLGWGSGSASGSGSEEWTWSGDIGPDACARVSTMQFVVPEGATGLSLDLSLSAAAAGIAATNRY